MIEIKNTLIEKAILVAVKTSNINASQLKEHLEELEMLASTAGAETVAKVVQERDRLDSAFFIGKGKVEEIAQLAELNDVNLIIFDDDLNPVQVRNLERIINKKIVDRSGLILDIFAARAQTNEAKTQVELAQMEYMLPRLTRAWTHLSKQFGGIGTKGPGETQIETDRRIIRSRISHLKNKLEKIESQRVTRSSNRKNFTNISLVGYTNAGKSTLLNLLTDAEVLAENKLFATLDSTTRILDISKQQKILLSDTVGFIRKLPHKLIASFKSTLNEVREADMLLHIIDVSNPFYEDHIKVVDSTLEELGCKEKIQIRVFNKVDSVNDKSVINHILDTFENSVVISAKKGMNISKLKELIISVIEKDTLIMETELNVSDYKKLAAVHSLAEVINLEYTEDKVNIKLKSSKLNINKLNKIIYEEI